MAIPTVCLVRPTQAAGWLIGLTGMPVLPMAAIAEVHDALIAALCPVAAGSRACAGWVNRTSILANIDQLAGRPCEHNAPTRELAAALRRLSAPRAAKHGPCYGLIKGVKIRSQTGSPSSRVLTDYLS